MLREIDFARLTLKDALDLAILIEDEAEDRYLEFAAQMEEYHTPEAGRFFRFMAGNEKKHGQALRQRRKEAFGEAPAAVDRDMLWEVEAPGYQDARAFMSARQALRVALESEKKAHAYFDRALPHVADVKAKALFQELREEEVQHMEMVRKEMDKTPPDDDLDPEAFVDEPPSL